MGYIVLSIMIGVILENFANLGNDTDVTFNHIEDFREAWRTFDPEGSFVIKSYNLVPLLLAVKQPLGVKGVQMQRSRHQLLRLQSALNIPDHAGFIHFTEVLNALSYHASGHVLLPACDVTKRLARSVNQTKRITHIEPAMHNTLTNKVLEFLIARFRQYIESHGGRVALGARVRWALDQRSAGCAVDAVDSQGPGLVGRVATGSSPWPPPVHAAGVWGELPMAQTVTGPAAATPRARVKAFASLEEARRWQLARPPATSLPSLGRPAVAEGEGSSFAGSPPPASPPAHQSCDPSPSGSPRLVGVPGVLPRVSWGKGSPENADSSALLRTSSALLRAREARGSREPTESLPGASHGSPPAPPPRRAYDVDSEPSLAADMRI